MSNYYNSTSNAYKLPRQYEQEDYVKKVPTPKEKVPTLPESRTRAELRRERAYIEKQRRATRMTPFVVLKLTLESLIIVAAACFLIFSVYDINMTRNKILQSENRYNTLVRENEDLKNDLVKNVNVKDIKSRAKKLGMKAAKSDSVRYYTTSSEEILIQIEEFPSYD